MIISELKAGVKNPDRVNVYIDGVYDFSLTVAQVVELKVKVGKELSEDEIKNLRKASSYGKLYQRTLEWVLSRPHSVRETRDYLRRKNAEPEDSEKIIATLIASKFLDDENFARFYVENRFVKKGVSRKRLEMELAKKGVPREITEKVFEETPRDDEAEIRKIIERKMRLKKFAEQPDKLILYLTRQGFDYQLSRSLVHEMGSQNSE